MFAVNVARAAEFAEYQLAAADS
jgi:hypothetical protein